jgi:hypothetical protein
MLEFGLELGLLSFRSPLPIRASQQFRQLGNVRRDPSRLVLREQLGR